MAAAAPVKNKGKGKATVMLPSILAKESDSSLLTNWKMVKQHFSTKKKSKGKAKEPKLSTSVDEQSTQLLQQLHNARVPEDVGADILENPVVQLALS
ncbi:hypothetical protein C0989_009614 [Termitomyces sp. Mn162]|nr:hypothetical protein C0989_009614 [Termitomyces sp. Mn162]